MFKTLNQIDDIDWVSLVGPVGADGAGGGGGTVTTGTYTPYGINVVTVNNSSVTQLGDQRRFIFR
jgi:hypothetical protein